MVNINWLVVAIAALIPLVIGAIWYSPKVLGGAWIKETGLTEEELKKANMAKIFGMTYLFSFMLAVILNPVVIHQFHIQSIFFYEMKDLTTEGTELNMYVTDFMDKNGHKFRTFKHGSFHGTIAGILFGIPIIGIISLFERKTAKYILVHAGYWVLSIALMGGVICQFT